MTRNQAIEIARQRALNTRDGHGYLPVTDADAATWMPHEWVVDSILWAAMQRGLAAIPTCTKCGYRVCHEDCGAEDYEVKTGRCTVCGCEEKNSRDLFTCECPAPTEVDLWAEIHRLRAAVAGPDGYASWQDAATAVRIRLGQAERELRNISEAKRFDRERFADDTSFSDWAQSRARHALDDAWPEKPPRDVPCQCASVGPDYCPRHTP